MRRIVVVLESLKLLSIAYCKQQFISSNGSLNYINQWKRVADLARNIRYLSCTGGKETQWKVSMEYCQSKATVLCIFIGVTAL